MRLIVFLLFISIISCQSGAKQNNKSDYSVIKIFDLIDRVYSIDRKDKYFRVKGIGKENIKNEYGVTAFNSNDILAYYKYGNFRILEYENEGYSSKAFQKVFANIKNKTGFYNNESEYFETLSKGGEVILLKGKYILIKYRRCNDDWKKNEKLEELLIEKLFASKPPKEKYFIRVCCSCPESKMEDLR